MTYSRTKGVWFTSRYVPVAVILVTLLILGGVIFLAHQQLRHRVREQISGRDARVLHALFMSDQISSWEAELAPVTEAADYLVPILATNMFRQLPTVRGTRLFDAEGRMVIGFPEDLPDADLSPHDLRALKDLLPVSHFRPEVEASDLSIFADETDAGRTLPLHEVLLPLHASGDERLLGVAQFLFDGTSLAAELGDLDRNLRFQAVGAFVTVGAILCAVLGLAFRQLQKTNATLRQRTQSLLHANQELALAAKTSAIGAVTAHLIHGLKNPLSGLQSFMTELGESPGRPNAGAEWDAAVSTTRRMQKLINETVRVLREQEGAAEYELTLDEMVELIVSRIDSLAKQSGVTFHAEVRSKARFNNRDANLVVLILENLVTNGLQATPAGGAVRLAVSDDENSIRCEVRDGGPGLAEHLKNSLFKPCQSTREGGSGIGLAISKQLANSLGAELELQSSTGSGCIFALHLPMALSLHMTPDAASPRTCIS